MNWLLSRLRAVLRPEPPEWIVNDIGELGVRVGIRFYFLYKGRSLEYDGLHDDGSSMRYRPVYKREFGEVCHPPGWGGHEVFKLNEGFFQGPDWKPIKPRREDILKTAPSQPRTGKP